MVWFERDNLEDRTVVKRQVEVPGASRWIAPGEAAPQPEYERQVLPIRTMVVPAREAGRFERVRYAGPFRSRVVVELQADERAVELLQQRLDRDPHPDKPHWRLCVLDSGPAWVRADGRTVRLRPNTPRDEEALGRLLSREDTRRPMEGA